MMMHWFFFCMLERFIIHLLQRTSYKNKICFEMPDGHQILGYCGQKNELWNHKAELFKFQTTPIPVPLCHQWVWKCPVRSLCTKSNYIWYVIHLYLFLTKQMVYQILYYMNKKTFFFLIMRIFLVCLKDLKKPQKCNTVLNFHETEWWVIKECKYRFILYIQV